MPALVRPFRAADAVAVVALAAEMAADLDDPPPGLTPEALVAAALGPDPWCAVLVAERAGLVAGFALFSRRFEAHRGQRALWLADLHVARAARRGGLARALLAAVGRRAQAEGCDRVAWDLWTLNAAGRALYRAAGARHEHDLEAWWAPAGDLARLAG